MSISPMVYAAEFEVFSYMTHYTGSFERISRSKNREGISLLSPHVDTNQRIFLPFDCVNLNKDALKNLIAAADIAAPALLDVSLYARDQTRKVTIISHYPIVLDRTDGEFDTVTVTVGGHPGHSYVFPQVVRDSFGEGELDLSIPKEQMSAYFTKNRGQAVLSWINSLENEPDYKLCKATPPIMFVDKVEHKPRAVLLTSDGAARRHPFASPLFEAFDEPGLILDLQSRLPTGHPKLYYSGKQELLDNYLQCVTDYSQCQEIMILDYKLSQFDSLFEEDNEFFIEDDPEPSFELAGTESDSPEVVDNFAPDASQQQALIQAVERFCIVSGIPVPESEDTLMQMAISIIEGTSASLSNVLRVALPTFRN